MMNYSYQEPSKPIRLIQEPISRPVPWLYDAEIAHWIKERDLRLEHPFRRKFQEDLVSDALKDMALYETAVERLRVELATQPEFRINQLYSFLDDNGTNRLFGAELQQGLKYFDIHAFNHDVMLVVLEYSMIDDNLNPIEFGRMLFPLSHIPTNAGNNDIKQFSVTPQTKLLIGKLFKMLLNAEVAAEYYRHEIKAQEIDLQGVFTYIDEGNKGLLSFDDIKTFLYSKGFYVEKEILEGVYRRFDKNNSGQVGYAEFCKELLPKL